MYGKFECLITMNRLLRPMSFTTGCSISTDTQRLNSSNSKMSLPEILFWTNPITCTKEGIHGSYFCKVNPVRSDFHPINWIQIKMKVWLRIETNQRNRVQLTILIIHAILWMHPMHTQKKTRCTLIERFSFFRSACASCEADTNPIVYSIQKCSMQNYMTH